jgi:hypothetical protein
MVGGGGVAGINVLCAVFVACVHISKWRKFPEMEFPRGFFIVCFQQEEKLATRNKIATIVKNPLPFPIQLTFD